MSYIEHVALPLEILTSSTEFPANWSQCLHAMRAMAPGCSLEAAWDCPWLCGSNYTLSLNAAQRDANEDYLTITTDGGRSRHARLRIARGGASQDRWEELRRHLSPRAGQIREGLASGHFALEAMASKALAAAMLEHCPRPSLLLGADGQVQYKNAEAKRVIDANCGLTIGPDNRLRLHVRAESLKLGGLIETLLKRFAGEKPAVTAMRFHAPSLHEIHGLQIKVIAPPVSPQEAALTAPAHGPWLVVTIHIQGMPARLSSETLALALDLTPAEANLVSALAAGQTLQSYADSAGLKITTVRWHLRNALSTTRLHSQTELVAFVLSLFS